MPWGCQPLPPEVSLSMVHVWLLASLLPHCGLNQRCQKHEWLRLELNLSHSGWSLILWSLRRGKTSSTHTTRPSCSRTCRALTLIFPYQIHALQNKTSRQQIGIWVDWLFMGQGCHLKGMECTWLYLFDCGITCVLLMSSWGLGEVNYSPGWLRFPHNCFVLLQPLGKHWNYFSFVGMWDHNRLTPPPLATGSCF